MDEALDQRGMIVHPNEKDWPYVSRAHSALAHESGDGVNQIVTVPSEKAFEMARRLAKEEGILCGISSGANVTAAIEYASLRERGLL